MDARSCVVVFASNIINLRSTCSNTCWGFFTHLANKRRVSWGRLIHYKGLEGTTFKLCLVDFENAGSAVQVFALLVFAMQVSNAGRGMEGQSKVICDVGDDGLSPHMAVVTLVHSLYRLGLLPCGRVTSRRQLKYDRTIKQSRKVLYPLVSNHRVVYFLKDIFFPALLQVILIMVLCKKYLATKELL